MVLVLHVVACIGITVVYSMIMYRNIVTTNTKDQHRLFLVSRRVVGFGMLCLWLVETHAKELSCKFQRGNTRGNG